MTRPATLADVARAAGVHPATVSRILNRKPGLSIRDETRERVERIAAEQGYRPNAMARGLRLASTGALGLLVPSLRNPVYAHIIRGAFRRAWERGFVVVLAEDAGGDEAALAYERLVREARIDGLLVASARPGSSLPARGAVPTVFVNRRHPDGPSVSMREEDAGALAAHHLLELGHTQLGHVAGPPELDTARRRHHGFVDAARAAGATARVAHAPFDERGGHTALAELLQARDGQRPTAVFVSNLGQSIGALAAAREAGLRVPVDLSVVTYDDDPLGEYLDPPLSAIRMPLAELGARGVDCVLDPSPTDVVIATAPELVVRASTARSGERAGGRP